MSDYGRREVFAITIACLIFAGLGVAGAVSRSIEAVLNRWVGIPLAVLGLVALAAACAREVWSWLLVEWELHRPLQTDEFEREGS